MLPTGIDFANSISLVSIGIFGRTNSSAILKRVETKSSPCFKLESVVMLACDSMLSMVRFFIRTIFDGISKSSMILYRISRSILFNICKDLINVLVKFPVVRGYGKNGGSERGFEIRS